MDTPNFHFDLFTGYSASVLLGAVSSAAPAGSIWSSTVLPVAQTMVAVITIVKLVYDVYLSARGHKKRKPSPFAGRKKKVG